jgi:phage terminase large subunit GpA-like protein
MLARGRWIAEHPEVKGHAGFHLPSYYSPLGWFSWREVVQDRLDAEKDPSGHLLKIWTNTVAAEPFVNAVEQVSDHSLKERAEKYKLGTVPMGGLTLSAAVDVQANRLEVKVKAWGRGEESWLIAYEVIFGDTETTPPWEALDEYLQRKFPHECGATLRIGATAVDAGYRTQTVFAWCRRRAHRHVFAVRGQSQAGKRILGLPTPQDVDHRGEKIHGGVKLWPIGTDTAKSKIYARLKITEPGPGCMHFPLGLPDEYYKGLTAERLVSRYHRGFLTRVWEKDAAERNEPLDLEVYAYAAGIYLGVHRCDWDRIEAGLRATAGDLFVQAQAKNEGQVAAGDAAAETTAPAAAPPAVQTSAPAPAAPRRKANWVTSFKGTR